MGGRPGSDERVSRRVLTAGGRPAWVPPLDRVQFLLVVGAAVALVAATGLVVTVPPADGFETSLVAAFPLAFWVAFYAVLATGIVVYFLSAATETGYWRHAAALVLADYALFFFLPLARGYRLYGRGASDILVHIGDVKGILATGSLWAGSWYPMQHVVVSELVLLGFPLRGAEYVVAYGFTAVLVLSFGALLSTLTGDRRAVAFGLAAGTPLIYSIFHTTIIPSFLSIMLFPAVLVLVERFRRSGSSAFLVAILVMGLGIVLFHPVTAAFLVVLLLATSAIGYVYTRVTNQPIRVVNPGLAFLVFPAIYAWYINFQETRSSIEQVVHAWYYRGTSPGEAVVSDAASVPLSLSELLLRFVELYGTVFVFLVVGGLFGLAVLWGFLHRRGRYPEVLATGQFGVGFGIALGFLSVFLIEFEPIRVSRYMILMAVVLVGLLLVRTTEWRPRRRRLGQGVLAIALVSAAALGAHAAYWPNEQLSDAEYEGSEFVLTNVPWGTPVVTYGIGHKMEWYVRGSVDPNLWPPSIGGGLPPNLGYDEHDYAAETFPRSYVVTQDFDREFYTAAYFSPEQRRELVVYDEADVARMTDDPTVDRVYDNGGFEAWFVPVGNESSPVG